MVTAFVFFVVENVHVAEAPICSPTQMQKAMENSCYFYTGDKIKHHLSDLNFAGIGEGSKPRVARRLKDRRGPVISTRGNQSACYSNQPHRKPALCCGQQSMNLLNPII